MTLDQALARVEAVTSRTDLTDATKVEMIIEIMEHFVKGDWYSE